MGDVGEFYEAYRTEQKQRRAKRLPERTEHLMRLKASGFHVERKTAYHFRINGCIDVFPIHNRWHDLRTQKRGGCKDLVGFIKSRLHPTDERGG